MANTDTTMDFSTFDEENSYTSQMQFSNYKLEWIIENFEFVCKNVESIESPVFPAQNLKDGQWFIILKPAELKEGNEEEFGIELWRSSNTPVRCMLVKISLLNSDGKGYHIVIPFEENIYRRKIKCSDLFKSLLCNGLLPVNVKVICKIRVFNSVNNVLQKSPLDPPEFDGLLQQMNKLYLDQYFNDITFIVEERIFKAHKAILALRSPVFAAMFKNKMSEELTTIVEIEDISPTAFKTMLQFIYTDKIENVNKLTHEIFYAAEKYQLDKLKFLCIDNFNKNISLETVVKTLELADIFDISLLKDNSMKYLISNYKEIKEAENYLKLLKDRSHLATEILDLMNKMSTENEETEECCKNANFQIRQRETD